MREPTPLNPPTTQHPAITAYNAEREARTYLDTLRWLGDLWTPDLLIPSNMRDNLDCLTAFDSEWLSVEASRLARVAESRSVSW